MSGLLWKHSSGLVVRSFQHLRTGAPSRLPLLSEQLWPFLHMIIKPQFRTFSTNYTYYDKAAANVSIEENEDVLRIRERDAHARKREPTEQEQASFTEKLDPEDDVNDLHATSIDETSADSSRHGDSEPAVFANETMSPVDEPATVTDTNTKSKSKQEQQQSNPGGVIDRLRKLSMTDISRYSEADMDKEPRKNPPRHFDQRLLKVLAVKNKLKSQRGRNGDYYNNYDDYDRPSHNRRGGGMYDDDHDEPTRFRPTQRYSSRGSPSYNDHQSNQRRQRNLEYDDDDLDEDDDIDFDASRRNAKSEASRLREQAQARRGMGSRRTLGEDDDDYEEIVKSRFVSRQKNSSHSSTKGENFD